MKVSRIPPLSIAVVRGHAIFLDCRADRYFVLSPGENEALLRLLDGDVISARAERALAEVMGVEPDAIHLRSLLATTIPAPQVRPFEAGVRPSWLLRLSAIRHLAGVITILKLRGFHAALERLARATAGHSLGEPAGVRDELDHVADAHEWLSRHVTASDACLVRSLALAHHVRSRGRMADLVIGVRGDPFAAHCWVQAGKWILNEDPDAVASFQPILVMQ